MLDSQMILSAREEREANRGIERAKERSKKAEAEWLDSLANPAPVPTATFVGAILISSLCAAGWLWMKVIW